MNNSEPTVIEVNAFTVAGLSVRTINNDEFKQETAKIPQLWNKFFSEGIAGKIPHSLAESPVFGVYSNYASNETDFYTLTAGVSIQPQSVCLEFNVVNIGQGRYLVFKNKGIMPKVVIKTWEQIWNYFAGNAKYKRRFNADFEVYLSSDEIAIYIGIMD